MHVTFGSFEPYHAPYLSQNLNKWSSGKHSLFNKWCFTATSWLGWAPSSLVCFATWQTILQQCTFLFPNVSFTTCCQTESNFLTTLAIAVRIWNPWKEPIDCSVSVSKSIIPRLLLVRKLAKMDISISKCIIHDSLLQKRKVSVLKSPMRCTTYPSNLCFIIKGQRMFEC